MAGYPFVETELAEQSEPGRDHLLAMDPFLQVALAPGISIPRMIRSSLIPELLTIPSHTGGIICQGIPQIDRTA